MSVPRVWVDENDLRLVLEMAVLSCDENATGEMYAAHARIKQVLDPPPPPPLRPYRANMQGHGA